MVLQPKMSSRGKKGDYSVRSTGTYCKPGVLPFKHPMTPGDGGHPPTVRETGAWRRPGM